MIEVNVPLGPIAYVKVSGASSHEVLAQLTDVLNGEIPSTVGRLVNETDAANVSERLGRVLGAEVVDHDTQALREDPRAKQADPVSEFTPQGQAQTAPAPTNQPTPRDPSEIEQLVPGAPTVLGRPAYFASWQDQTGSHGAFVHPFLYEQNWEKATADPNDQRLATGEAWFFQQSY